MEREKINKVVDDKINKTISNNISEMIKASQSMKDESGSAFPCQGIESCLTKREWFAGMALQGLCANPNIIGWTEHEGTDYKLDNARERDQLVFRSYLLADAMLAASEEENP